MSTLDQQPLEQPAPTPPSDPAERRTASEKSRKRRLHPVVRWTVPALAAALLGGALGAGFAATIHVPEVASITELNPGLVTELSDRDDRIFRTYFNQRRQLLRSGEIPDVLRDALLASEDSRFFEHGGVDLLGIFATVADNILKSERRGASTLTMQLAGSVFLDRTQRTWERKIREAFHAVELEKTLSKDQILTLYGNWINLGHGNYGFRSAAAYYFDKEVADLTAAEAATLVAIIPRPSDWSPIRRREFMEKRRNLVLARMRTEGYLDDAQFEEARSTPLETRRRPDTGAPEVAPYFAEEVRKQLYATYGEKGLYERGLRVRTTLDPRIQSAVDRALHQGLMEVDRATRGWRGAHLELTAEERRERQLDSWANLDWQLGSWVEAVVLEASASRARVRVAEREFVLPAEAVAWTRKARVDQVFSAGDVVFLEIVGDADAPEEPIAPAADEPPAATTEDESEEAASGPVEDKAPVASPIFELVQKPEIEGAVVVLDNDTGAIRALGGGWSFERSEFNRATQARRQPGSAFKPFVYGAAFEAGYTPADSLFDAPVVFESGDGTPTYSPRNFYRNYLGILTLRRALERSINVSAVKLQDMVGVDQVIDLARRAGVESPLPPFPSLALGSVELTPIELAAAYASIANQGTYLEPYLVERVENADGRQLELHRPRAARAMEPSIAYLLTHTLRGVVQHGTATAVRRLPVAAAGKTGTTDGYTDAWFAGFTPELTVVTWVGYDRKRRIGRNMTGARAALPIWTSVIEQGLEGGWIANSEERDFPVPPGVIFRDVELDTGLLVDPVTLGLMPGLRVVNEAFLVGTEPVQSYTAQAGSVQALPWYQQRRWYGKPKDRERMPEDIEDWDAVIERRQEEDS